MRSPYVPSQLTATCSLVFPPDPVWVRNSREAVRTLLAAAGRAGEVIDTALLLTSEIVTNAVNACRNSGCASPVTVLAELVGHVGDLRVLVMDDSPGLPERRAARPGAGAAAGGRGLPILAACATAWGVCAHPASVGKTVWFELAHELTHAETFG